MEDFNQNKPSGELNGFDSVENRNENPVPSSDNGFYTKQGKDIIQDEWVRPEPSFVPPTQQNPPPYNTNTQYSGNYYTVSPKPQKTENKKRYGIGAVILSAVIAAVVGAVTCVSVMLPLMHSNGETPFVAETEESETVKNNVNINIDKTASNVVEAVAEKVTPSVVGIRTTTSVMSFFGGTSEASGDGSGVVYSSNGYIITNYHVIGDAIGNSSGKIEVYTDSASSKSYTASVVGYNISADLAVIKIDAKNLTAIQFADSDKLKVGQYVITVGNPGGLEFMDSVTYGVVSGLNRVVSSDSQIELIQTDAAINPGNSGGALVNAEGKLVGINSSKIVSEEFEGMGFAIPSNTVKEICKKIIEKENSPDPYIGISISEKYTAEVLEYYGYPTGAVVLSVAEGSPAENAGIRKGDIITEFDGKAISNYNLLDEFISETSPGDKVEISLYRGGRYYTTEIEVGSNNAVN